MVDCYELGVDLFDAFVTMVKNAASDTPLAYAGLEHQLPEVNLKESARRVSIDWKNSFSLLAKEFLFRQKLRTKNVRRLTFPQLLVFRSLRVSIGTQS